MEKRRLEPGRNNSERTQKLSAYSAFAACLLLANQADGQVVYTDVDPDFILTEPLDAPFDDQLSVDLNADGSPEGLFVFSSFAFDGSCYTAGSMSFYFINYASVLMNTLGTGIQPLVEGELISTDGNWNDFVFQTMMFSDFFNNTCDSDDEYPFIGGIWRQESEQYMGIRFQDASSDTHYGYVRLSVQIDSVAGEAQVALIRVYGYAFEETADTPIQAGVGYQPDSVIEQDNVTVNLYPNPATTEINILLGIPGGWSGNVELTDLSGRKVADYHVQNQLTVKLDVSQLSAGVYLFRIMQENGNLASGRFVKQ